MKQKMHFVEKWLFLLVIMVAVLIPTLSASATSQGRDTGNVTVSLKIEENAIQGVEFSLYQVGRVNPATDSELDFIFFDEYQSLGIDLHSIKDASQLKDAADRLYNIASTASGSTTAFPPQTTDANGQVRYSGLQKGLYILVKTGGDENVTVDSLLFSVPYFNNGSQLYDIELFPKPQIKTPNKRSLRVVKKVVNGQNEPGYVESRTYEIGLFRTNLTDEQLTRDNAEQVKQITITAGSEGECLFENLDLGAYYVLELGQNGVAIRESQLNTTVLDADGNECVVSIELEGASADHPATLEVQNLNEDKEYSATLTNKYTEVPISATLRIRKVVIRDGEEQASDAHRYYANVFRRTDTGDQKLNTDPIELQVDDYVEFAISLNHGETVECYAEECDAQGNRIDGNSVVDFIVEVSPSSVSFDETYVSRDVTITNTYPENAVKLNIWKHTVTETGEPQASNETFYAGLFTDEAHTQMLSGNYLIGSNPIPINMGGSADMNREVTIILPAGQSELTVYPYEVMRAQDGSWQLVDNTFPYAFYFMDGEYEGVTIQRNGDEQEIHMYNEPMPENPGVFAHMKVKKQVFAYNDQKQLVAENVTDTFYAGIYLDEACTQLAGFNVLKGTNPVPLGLENASESLEKNLTIDLRVNADGSLPTQVLYVMEVIKDAEGNWVHAPNAESFRYAVDITQDGSEDGNKATVTTVNTPSVIIKNTVAPTRLTVWKHVVNEAGEPVVSNDTFYAALYTDAEHTTLLSSDYLFGASNPIAIPLVGTSERFKQIPIDLPEGELTVYPYEVVQVDGNWVPVVPYQNFKYVFYMQNGEEEGVKIPASSTDKEIHLYNEPMPEGPTMSAELELVKQVFRIGTDGTEEALNVTDTFYAGIFTDEACTKLAGRDITSEPNPVALSLNDASEFSKVIPIQIMPQADGSPSTVEIYVRELFDPEGDGTYVYADNSPTFAYTVTISGRNLEQNRGKISITANDKYTVTIKNTLKPGVTPTPILTPTVIPTTTPPPYNTPVPVPSSTPVPPVTGGTTHTDTTTGGSSSSSSNFSENSSYRTTTDYRSDSVVQNTGSVTTLNVKTGDDTPIALYVAILAGAAAVIIILVIRRKHR